MASDTPSKLSKMIDADVKHFMCEPDEQFKD